jgi:hypothetical protein
MILSIDNKSIILFENVEDNYFLCNEILNLGFKNDSIIIFEDYKNSILGSDTVISNDQIKDIQYDFDNYNVLEIIIKIIKTRYNQDIPTFLILNSEMKQKDKKTLLNHLNDFKKNISVISYTEKNIKIEFKERKIPTEKIDVIGDIHGLYDDFVKIIEPLGYTIENNIIKHKNNRKILFLGDLVDKGQQSLEMIKIVYNSVTFGGHYCIIGNHENKIIQFKKHYDKFGVVNTSSFSSSETILELLKINKNEFIKYLNFIEDLPAYYIFDKYAFVHANVQHFDPKTTIKYKLMYGGDKETDIDNQYQKLKEKKINKYTLIRGHNPQYDGCTEDVFSLDFDQALNGELAILPFDKFIEDNKKMSKIESFNKNVIKRKVDFDYKKHQLKFEFYKKLIEAESSGVLFKEENKEKTICLFKQTKKINSINYKKFDPLLLDANGIVFDFSGNIIINPLSIIFDYNRTDKKNDNLKIIAREKVFGQIINVSIDPFKDDLIFSSSQYINDSKLRDNFKLLNKSSFYKIKDVCKKMNLTLTFCNYKSTMLLINAKINKLYSDNLTENELDNILNIEIKSNDIQRPKWKITTILELESEIKTNNEQYLGYVVRKNSESQKYLFNINTEATNLFRFLSMISINERKIIKKNPSVIVNRYRDEFSDFTYYIHNQNIDISIINDNEKYNIISKFFDSKASSQ